MAVAKTEEKKKTTKKSELVDKKEVVKEEVAEKTEVKETKKTSTKKDSAKADDKKDVVKEEVVQEKKEAKPSKENSSEKSKPEVWGILHIYSSYNNTHLHVTDVTGGETIAKVTGGMVSKSDRLKATPNVAMAAAKQISEECHNAGITSLYVKLRAVGGHNGPMTPGPGSQAAIKMLTRYGIKLGRIEDVTPVPHDSCRKKGGRRGRRV